MNCDHRLDVRPWPVDPRAYPLNPETNESYMKHASTKDRRDAWPVTRTPLYVPPTPVLDTKPWTTWDDIGTFIMGGLYALGFLAILLGLVSLGRYFAHLPTDYN